MTTYIDDAAAQVMREARQQHQPLNPLSRPVFTWTSRPAAPAATSTRAPSHRAPGTRRPAPARAPRRPL